MCVYIYIYKIIYQNTSSSQLKYICQRGNITFSTQAPKKTKVLATQVHDLYHIVLHDGSYIDVTADFECYRWLGKANCFCKGWIHDHAIEFKMSAATRAF